MQRTNSLQLSVAGRNLQPSNDSTEPRYPDYASEQRRIESFSGHRMSSGQSADALAKAGFFSVG